MKNCQCTDVCECVEVCVRGKCMRSFHIFVHMRPSAVRIEIRKYASTVQYAHAEVFTAEQYFSD